METAYPLNHPLAVKLWAKKLFHEALTQTFMKKFVGPTSNSLCQEQTETKKGSGDRIRMGLRMQLNGAGVQGDETLEGNEEALTTYYDDIFIDQLRHAVRSKGKMSEQRVTFSLREEARMGLQDWWADRLDTWFFNQLAGNTSQTDVRYTGMQATIAPDAEHLFASAGHSTEASLSDTTTHSFQLSDIDRAVAKAKSYPRATTPILRPVDVSGDKLFVLFLHPRQMRDLRTANASTVGSYVDLFKAAMQGGKYKDNPIVTGASFIYNNTIVHETERVPTVPGQTDRFRAIFCGAQAAGIAYGQDSNPEKMSWVEEQFDFKNQLAVSAGMIAGIKKSRFNSKDFATIVISSYAQPL